MRTECQRLPAYSLDELFAEKTRALFERTRPRDLYDVGFAGFLAVRWLIPTRFVGLLSCVLTATSTIALYSYLFIAAYKVFIIVAVLGVTLGALLNIVLFPRILAAAGSAKHQASG